VVVVMVSMSCVRWYVFIVSWCVLCAICVVVCVIFRCSLFVGMRYLLCVRYYVFVVR